jgi:hypothetical protein
MLRQEREPLSLRLAPTEIDGVRLKPVDSISRALRGEIKPIDAPPFRITDSDDADFVVATNYLDAFVYSRGFPRLKKAIRELPDFDRLESRYVFFLNRDEPDLLDVSSAIYRASLDVTRRDPGALAFPYETGDPGEPSFDDFDRLPYDVSFQGYVGSSVARYRIAKALLRAREPIRAFVKPIGKWHGAEFDEKERERLRREHRDSIRNAKIVMCPRGFGVNSMRFFETAAEGRVPFLVSDRAALPFADEIDYDRLLPRLDEDRAKSADVAVADFLDGVSAETLRETAREWRRTWKRFFSPEGTAGAALRFLKRRRDKGYPTPARRTESEEERRKRETIEYVALAKAADDAGEKAEALYHQFLALEAGGADKRTLAQAGKLRTRVAMDELNRAANRRP